MKIIQFELQRPRDNVLSGEESWLWVLTDSGEIWRSAYLRVPVRWEPMVGPLAFLGLPPDPATRPEVPFPHSELKR